MKSLGVILALIFYLTVVCGRNLQEFDTKDPDLELENHGHTNQMRHRRRSRQSFYYPPYYYNDRRDYDDRRDYYSRTQEEMLSKILNQLEEIASFIKRPAPPPPPPQAPQIIYIPVPYPVPQYTISRPNPPKKGVNITLTDRWPDMDDENQNWGLIAGDTGEESISGDGSRPINLEPIEPKEPVLKQPEVEHGSVQAGMTTTTIRPSSKGSPGRCKAAILVCCQYSDDQDKQDCFAKYNCNKTYSTGITCLPEIIKRVIAEFSETYAPINKA